MKTSVLIVLLCTILSSSHACEIDTVLKQEAYASALNFLGDSDTPSASISVHLIKYQETFNTIYLIKIGDEIWRSYFIEYGYTPEVRMKFLFISFRKSKAKKYYKVFKAEALSNIKNVVEKIEEFGASNCNGSCEENTCYEVNLRNENDIQKKETGLNCEASLNNLILLLESDFFIGSEFQGSP